MFWAEFSFLVGGKLLLAVVTSAIAAFCAVAFEAAADASQRKLFLA
jgi:hypothetical protein